MKDVVNFLRAAMNKVDCNASVYNVCTGNAVSINQLAKSVMSITSNQVLMTHVQQRSGDVRVSVGNPGFSSRMLDVVAKQSLINGLCEYIEYVVDTKAWANPKSAVTSTDRRNTCVL